MTEPIILTEDSFGYYSDWDSSWWCDYDTIYVDDKDSYLKKQILSNQESLKNIREYLEVMKGEPEGYIKLSKVYHDIRKMIGDE